MQIRNLYMKIDTTVGFRILIITNSIFIRLLFKSSNTMFIYEKKKAQSMWEAISGCAFVSNFCKTLSLVYQK
jgi:hypothetical protein